MSNSTFARLACDYVRDIAAVCGILAIAFALAGCATLSNVATPGRCSSALGAATTAEDLIAALVGLGYDSSKAYAVAQAIQIGKLGIALVCAGSGPAHVDQIASLAAPAAGSEALQPSTSRTSGPP